MKAVVATAFSAWMPHVRIVLHAPHDQATATMPDESLPPPHELEAPAQPLQPANDNGTKVAAPVDPRVLTIARAIGRYIARQQLKALQAANENKLSEEQ